jgi:hypothetical protein
MYGLHQYAPGFTFIDCSLIAGLPVIECNKTPIRFLSFGQFPGILTRIFLLLQPILQHPSYSYYCVKKFLPGFSNFRLLFIND